MNPVDIREKNSHTAFLEWMFSSSESPGQHDDDSQSHHKFIEYRQHPPISYRRSMTEGESVNSHQIESSLYPQKYNLPSIESKSTTSSNDCQHSLTYRRKGIYIPDQDTSPSRMSRLSLIPEPQLNLSDSFTSTTEGDSGSFKNYVADNTPVVPKLNLDGTELRRASYNCNQKSSHQYNLQSAQMKYDKRPRISGIHTNRSFLNITEIPDYTARTDNESSNCKQSKTSFWGKIFQTNLFKKKKNVENILESDSMQDIKNEFSNSTYRENHPLTQSVSSVCYISGNHTRHPCQTLLNTTQRQLVRKNCKNISFLPYIKLNQRRY